MAISSINSVSPAPATGTQGGRAPGLPEESAVLRADVAAAQGSGTRPIDASRGVNTTVRTDSTRDQVRQDKPKPGIEQVMSAVEQLNDFVKTSSSNLQFSVDKESGMRIIKVVDPETKEVIRQIPSEEAVEIAKAIDRLQGLLIRQTA